MGSSSRSDDYVRRRVKPNEAMTTKVPLNKGLWTPEEDMKLAETIALHGAKRWSSMAANAGIYYFIC